MKHDENKLQKLRVKITRAEARYHALREEYWRLTFERDGPAPYVRFGAGNILTLRGTGKELELKVASVTQLPPLKAITPHEWIYMNCLEPSDG